MQLIPSADYIELGYLEFYQTKGKLADGTYKVIEGDGEINFVVLANRGVASLTEWFSEAEYHVAIADAKQECHR